MIEYRETPEEITADMLKGFCVGWAKPLTPSQLHEILKNSYKIVIAVEDNNVIGFINSISDKIKFAFIPMLEILPEYQNQGIGSELVKRLFAQLEKIDNIDLMCDKELQAYYEKFGMIKYTGMVIRKHLNQ